MTVLKYVCHTNIIKKKRNHKQHSTDLRMTNTPTSFKFTPTPNTIITQTQTQKHTLSYSSPITHSPDMNHPRRLLSLPRSSSCNSTIAIVPSNYISSTSFIIDPNSVADNKPLVGNQTPVGCAPRFFRSRSGVAVFLRSVFNIVSVPAILPSCRWLNFPNQLSLTPSTGLCFNIMIEYVNTILSK